MTARIDTRSFGPARRTAVRTAQRGAATLVVTLLLLLLGTLAVLSSARPTFLNQKTATATYHYEQARAAAQAGLARGLSYLARVDPATTPNRQTFIDSTTHRLRAGAPVSTERLPESRAGYRIAFEQPDAADPALVRIVATGCADDCTGEHAPSVRMTQLVKFRKLVAAPPIDALISRGPVDKVSGNFSVNAADPGAPIRSGYEIADLKGSADTGGRAPVANDLVLREASAETFFRYFFGDAPEAVWPLVPTLPEGSSSTEQGGAWRTGDGTGTVRLGSNDTYGSPEHPVVLIVQGDLHLNGTPTVYGFIYVTGNLTANGNATVRGAIAVQGSVGKLNGSMSLVHDAELLARLSAWGAPAAVPGGWKDF